MKQTAERKKKLIRNKNQSQNFVFSFARNYTKWKIIIIKHQEFFWIFFLFPHNISLSLSHYKQNIVFIFSFFLSQFSLVDLVGFFCFLYILSMRRRRDKRGRKRGGKKRYVQKEKESTNQNILSYIHILISFICYAFYSLPPPPPLHIYSAFVFCFSFVRNKREKK